MIDSAIDYAIAGLVAGVFTTVMLFLIVLYSEYKEKKDKRESAMKQEFEWIPINKALEMMNIKNPYSEVVVRYVPTPGVAKTAFRCLMDITPPPHMSTITHFAFIPELPSATIQSGKGILVNRYNYSAEEIHDAMRNRDDKIEQLERKMSALETRYYIHAKNYHNL